MEFDLKPYLFGNGKADGDSSLVKKLGGKGAHLAEMSKMGIPVPTGFTLPVDFCRYFYQHQGQADVENFDKQLESSIIQGCGNSFSSYVLVSVRSGAPVSMPGMMDTILNIGLNENTISYFEKELGDRAAWDSYRRLYQMFGITVFNIPAEEFNNVLISVKQKQNITDDKDLNIDSLKLLVQLFKEIYQAYVVELPNSLNDQIRLAAYAVIKSWDSERTVLYRQKNNIPNDLYTAITVQQMVFGNYNDFSCSGVLFTRNPNNGQPGLFGEYLVNAQGEDVVAGTHTPKNLDTMKESSVWSGIYSSLEKISYDLEQHYKNMQDIEFTVQDSKLFILQTRTGKRTAYAAFEIAYDLVKEGVVKKSDISKLVTSKQYYELLKDKINPDFKDEPTFTGLPACNGLVTGTPVFDSKKVKAGQNHILVAKETSVDDMKGMINSIGIVTSHGGATSHAAVVARSMDRACVVGCSDLYILGNEASVNGVYIYETSKITLDGATGRVWVDKDVPIVQGELSNKAKWVVDTIYLNACVYPSSEVCRRNVGVKLVDVMFDDKKYKQFFKSIKPSLKNCIIDLSRPDIYMMPEDNVFWGMDDVEGKYLMYVNAVIDRLVAINCTGVYVVLDDKATKEMIEKLSSLGQSNVVKVNNIKDLLDSGGKVEISDVFIETVIGGQEAYSVLKKALKKIGKRIKETKTRSMYIESII